MKVKVCGMRDAGNIAETAALKPDYMGFIFYKPSPRNCFGMDSSIIASLPEGIDPVMVSVDMTEDEIIETAGHYGFHVLQLHGKEAPEMCENLRRRGFKVIKAIGMHSKGSLKEMQEYTGAIDLFLLDTHTTSKGGSGRKFDWSILNDYDFKEPFMLSGGIGPDDAETILSVRHPNFYGIDLNSRFESSPGIKNVPILHHFLHQLNKKY